MILERIRSGAYPMGSKLPSLRAAANEFEVHSNTVSVVYRSLTAEGILRTVHGSGTFVIRLPPEESAVDVAGEVAAELRDLALKSRRLGLSRKDFSDLAAAVTEDVFDDAEHSVWFVECSIRDAEELSTSLGAILDRTIRPLLTDDLELHAENQGGANCLYITTPYHVEEVEEGVGEQHPVVNVQVVPTSETLVRLAHIPAGSRVSVVASNAPTLERLVHMVRTYLRVEPVHAELVDSVHVERAIKDADVVIDSHAVHDRVVAGEPTGSILTVHYQIEPTSVAYLREVLNRREAESLLPAHGNPHDDRHGIIGS